MSELTQQELATEFKSLYPKLVRFGQSLTGIHNRVDAEELVMSIFLKFVRDRREGKEMPVSVEPFLKTSMRNLNTDRYRKQTIKNKSYKPNDPTNLEPKRYPLFKLTNFQEEDEILQQTEKNPLFDPFIKDGLNEALKKTGERCGELLRLIAMGYKYEEIADRQGSGTNTVASGVYRCRAKLLEFLETEKGLFEDIMQKIFKKKRLND